MYHVFKIVNNYSRGRYRTRVPVSSIFGNPFQDDSSESSDVTGKRIGRPVQYGSLVHEGVTSVKDELSDPRN